MNRHSYNPPGVCKNPIPVRLMDEERNEAGAIAKLSGVSRSKVLRDAIVAGLPIVREALLSKPTPSRRATDKVGAASSPAVLSED